MKIKTSKMAITAALGLVVCLAQTGVADTRTEKVQRETRAGAAGGAAVGATVATIVAGPEMAVAGANAGAIVGGVAVGTCSSVLRSGDVQRMKKDLSRHKKNVKRALKKLKL